MQLTIERNGYVLVNERAVRAGTGVMFVFGFFLLMRMYYDFDLALAFGVIFLLWVDFFVKAFWGAKFSFFMIVGGLLVSGQTPEYVGEVQKRFAWMIGWVLSGIVLSFISYHLFFISSCTHLVSCKIPLFLCLLCLVFMWLETSVGFCVGCHIYGWLRRKGFIKGFSEKDQPCAGGICSIKKNKKK